MAEKIKDFKTFEQWYEPDITGLLRILPNEHSEILRQWTDVRPDIPENLKAFTEAYRKKLKSMYRYWNETELLGGFIIPFLHTVEWQTQHFNLFNGRPLKAKVKGYDVKGVTDGMVASGIYEPVKPYFFIHEYKRMKHSDSDPLGQVLIAMLAAQALNNDGKPIYGCYMIGTYWRFVLLNGDEYSESQGYDVSDETEIQIVWAILKRTKEYIQIRVLEDLNK